MNQPYPHATSQIAPHRARRRDLPVGDTHLAALENTPRAGDPARAAVLLLPGYTGSKEDFAPLLDPLADAGLHLVAVDLPGQHESPGPAREADYETGRLAAVLTGLVERLRGHGDVLLLGHSFGGLIARAMLLDGAPVAGLTLLDSGPGALPDGPRRAALELGAPVLREHGLAAVQRLREAQDGVPEPAELADLLRARFLGSTVAGLLGMADALLSEPDRTDELAAALARSATPGLVACGVDDDAWPVGTQADMATRLDAPFRVIAEAGHSPAVENPSALLDVLRSTWDGWLTSDAT